MVDAPQVVVVDLCVPACEGGRAAREPLEILGTRGLGAGSQGPVGKPPEEDDADSNGDDAVDEEHPLEADEAALAVHFLEACRHQAHDSGGDLSRSEVLADAFARPRGRVEEGEIIGHSGPHAGNEDAQQKTEETVRGQKLQTPRNRRKTYYKLHAAFMAAMQLPMIPTLITIRLIQTCGLSLVITRFDGKSKTT